MLARFRFSDPTQVPNAIMTPEQHSARSRFDAADEISEETGD
jgi:hypothetical protein